jgi:hypothetical protein
MKLKTCVFLCTLSLSSLSYAQNGDPLDLNSIRSTYYDITLSSKFGSGLIPGQGVDMSDPYNPHSSPLSPFIQQVPSETDKRSIYN